MAFMSGPEFSYWPKPGVPESEHPFRLAVTIASVVVAAAGVLVVFGAEFAAAAPGSTNVVASVIAALR
jgi:hypothetical protein